jgi:NADPH-dependent 2,4-dienoyl-CoA reductase/sulfur reductase-like enzyme/rhodanese-related sulfurtransferase
MKQNIVIIGGVAAGTKAASRLKRLNPEADVTILDKDKKISYGGCGIPYYVSGDIADETELRSTAFHMLRDEVFFEKIKGVKVRVSEKATRIDRENKKVHSVDLAGTRREYPYDKIVLTTGSKPRIPPFEGTGLANVFTAANLTSAIRIKELVSSGKVNHAVIIGAGFIGLEMAEAISDMWEIDTAVVEIADQVMPGFVSPSLAEMAKQAMEKEGVRFFLGEKVEGLTGNGQVQKVVTNKRELSADLVIVAAGALPETTLARESGLEIGKTGGIRVNEYLQTSDPDIYAGGDCIELTNLVSGKPGFFPLGSIANREGRVIASNLAGRKATFEGAVGSFVVKLFDHTLAGTGLSLKSANDAGFDAVSVTTAQLDRAHFYPEKELVFLDLVVDRQTRRVLGVQGFAQNGDMLAGKISAVAAMLKFGPVVSDLSNLEFPYSPPYSSAMDAVNTLANVAENLLDGNFKTFDAKDFNTIWEGDNRENHFFIDCREKSDAEPFLASHPKSWNNFPQGEIKEFLSRIPEGKQAILVCNTGARAYEAQLNLRESGFENSVVVMGGMATLNKLGYRIEEDEAI